MSVKLEFKRFNFKNGAIQLDGGGGVYTCGIDREGNQISRYIHSKKKVGRLEVQLSTLKCSICKGKQNCFL